MSDLAQRLFQTLSVSASRLAYVRFQSLARRAGDVNRELLQRILKRQQDTDFGRRHSFSAIHDVRDFQRAVPLATYDDIRSDIERMARGEQNVLTVDPVTAFALSSGTTGTEKLIPLTAYSLGRAREQFFYSRGALLKAIPAAGETGPGVLLMGAIMRGQTEAGIPTGALTAITMSSMLKSRYMPLLSPPEVYLVRKHVDALYLHLLFALAEPSVRFLTAAFASTLLDFLQLLEARWPALVQDLRSGMLNPEIELPPELAGPIRARLRAHPERARILAREAERGFDGIARRIWPKLAYTSAITTGSFAIYAEKLHRYLGDLPNSSSALASSEAFLGISAGVGSSAYTLLPTSAFFEFIPADELDAPEPPTKGIDELEPGGRYEIVVTTFSGLYRYRMGDVVEVEGHLARLPQVRFLYRRGSLLNIAGEKTSEHATRQALTQALAKEGLEIVDFSAMEDVEHTPKRYVFFVELAPRDRAANVPQIEVHLEQALREANPYYVTLRARLGPLLFVPVKPGTFQGLRELLVQRGASATQVKVPRLVHEGPLAQFLRDHRAATGETPQAQDQ